MPNDSLVPQIFAVAAVFLLLGGALWWLRRRGLVLPARRRSAARRLEVVERMALGPQQTLHLVRFDGALLLIACWPAGCSLLDTRDGAHPSAALAAELEASR